MRLARRSLHGVLFGVLVFLAVLPGAWPSAQVQGKKGGLFFDKERDTPFLPPACQARLGPQTAPEYKLWETTLTHEIFFHLHHYCFGVFEIKKAKTGIGIDKADRKALYRDAVTQFDYVLKRWPKTHALYQEALKYRQEAYTAAYGR